MRFQRLYFNQEFLIQSYLLHISRYLYSDHKTTDSVESLSGNTLFLFYAWRVEKRKKSGRDSPSGIQLILYIISAVNSFQMLKCFILQQNHINMAFLSTFPKHTSKVSKVQFRKEYTREILTFILVNKNVWSTVIVSFWIFKDISWGKKLKPFWFPKQNISI